MAVQKRRTKAGKTVFIARWRDPSGKEHSKSFARARDAKEWLGDMERETRKGRPTGSDVERMTVLDVYNAWLHHRPLRPASIQQYEFTRDRQLGWLAKWPVRQVTPEIVTRWHTELRNGRSWWGTPDNGVSETTATNCLRHLRTAMKWAVEQEIIPRNPVHVTVKSQAIEPDDIPTMAEAQKVINGLVAGGVPYTEIKTKGGEPRTNYLRPDPVLADMLLTAAMTGMRISELCGLIGAEVDLDAGVIRVRKQLGKVEPRSRVELKTRASRRDIPIAPELAPVLQRRIANRPGGEYVFLSSTGQAMIHSRAAVKVKRVALHVGAPRVHFHAMRHYFASSLLTDGVPVQDVARVMGHSPNVLLSTYAHVLSGSQDRITAAISAHVGKDLSPGCPALRAVGE